MSNGDKGIEKRRAMLDTVEVMRAAQETRVGMTIAHVTPEYVDFARQAIAIPSQELTLQEKERSVQKKYDVYDNGITMGAGVLATLVTEACAPNFLPWVAGFAAVAFAVNKATPIVRDYLFRSHGSVSNSSADSTTANLLNLLLAGTQVRVHKDVLNGVVQDVAADTKPAEVGATVPPAKKTD